MGANIFLHSFHRTEFFTTEIPLNLPKYILVAHSDGWKFDGFVVVDFDVDSDRTIEEVHYTAHHLVDEKTHSSANDKHPNNSEMRRKRHNLIISSLFSQSLHEDALLHVIKLLLF